MQVYNNQNTKDNRRQLKKQMTEAEQMLWKHIRNDSLGVRFRRQYGIGSYIADFYSPTLKLVIELDGSQHFTPEALEYDKIREEFMNSLGIKTIKFNNNDVMTNIEGIL
jgi:very-short-patch-repair endonuclease